MHAHTHIENLLTIRQNKKNHKKNIMDYVVIVAGGKGLRMGSDIPKQFLPVNGFPVLMHTIKRFKEYSTTLKIILVLPKEQQEYWHELCKNITSLLNIR